MDFFQHPFPEPFMVSFGENEEPVATGIGTNHANGLASAFEF